MPKLKTNRGAAKRIKISKSGQMKRAKAFGSHILTKKSRKRKRNIKKGAYVSAADATAVKRMLPYG